MKTQKLERNNWIIKITELLTYSFLLFILFGINKYLFLILFALYILKDIHLIVAIEIALRRYRNFRDLSADNYDMVVRK